jgi:hypothetical protein
LDLQATDDDEAACPSSLRNDPTQTILSIYLGLIDDSELKPLFDALKKNKVVKLLRVDTSTSNTSPVLSVDAALSLASAVSVHPGIKGLSFSYGVSFEKFSPIALAVQSNNNLTHLELRQCEVTPKLAKSLSFLLTENALESLVLKTVSIRQRVQSLDISRGLLSNKSLKEFTFFL